MTDFVLEQNTEFVKDKLLYDTDWNLEFEKFSKLMISYAKFLKQPLTLGMFVPCDEDDNVLEDPKRNKTLEAFPYERFDYGCKLDKYQKAKEKVLFIFPEPVKGVFVEAFKFHIEQKRTVEYFTQFGDIQLTESAIKQLGL